MVVGWRNGFEISEKNLSLDQIHSSGILAGDA